MGVKEINEDRWLHDVFPEWGTWLNEEIENEEVKPGTFAMWWLGCTGIWVKSEGDANIMIDFWTRSGKRTKKNPLMNEQHQHQRMIGCVALGSFGENPRGMTDKINAADMLRMAESLKTQVIIPIHHDVWTNFMADPQEIKVLWNMKKDRLKYTFKPFIWPENKDDLEFMFDRGFHDAFAIEPDLPFRSLL